MKKRNEVVEQHYRTHYETLVRRNTSALGSVDAEDAVMEAYARGLKYWDSFDPDKSKFQTWFGMILLNAVRDAITKQMEGGEVHLKPAMLQMTASMDDKVSLEELLSMLDAQKPPVRDALYLTLVLGYSYAEAADMHPASAMAIAKMVERFRATL